MRPFKLKSETIRSEKRRHRQFRAVKHVKLRESTGIVQTKRKLRCSLLNVDGLSEASLANVETTIASKRPDIVALLETKRRVEETGIDISIPGYALHESKRSNNAGDCDGCGIAVYAKLSDGLIFKRHSPDIVD